jgi:hypothetical protein
MHGLYNESRQAGGESDRRWRGWKKVSAVAVLEKERKVYEKQKSELLKTNPYQFALVHDDKVVGTYTTFAEAYEEGVKRFGLESFFISQIREDNPQAQNPALVVGALIGR